MIDVLSSGPLHMTTWHHVLPPNILRL